MLFKSKNYVSVVHMDLTENVRSCGHSRGTVEAEQRGQAPALLPALVCGVNLGTEAFWGKMFLFFKKSLKMTLLDR